MENTSSYILSAYAFIFENSLEKILNTGYQSKYGNPIPSFEENILTDLCTKAEQIFSNENNILEINGDIIIVGDIHGSLHDLLRILKFIYEQDSKVLFLGDYVDRGNFSLECITLLLALKIEHPDKYFLIRGNHEFDSVCSQYGFKKEIFNYNTRKLISFLESQKNSKLKKASTSVFNANSIFFHPNEYSFENLNLLTNSHCYKYTEKLYTAFMKTFSYLPIAAKLNKTTFCIHGGLSPKLLKADDLNIIIKRPIDKIEDNSILSDIMWSDPSNDLDLMFNENPRGLGHLFNGKSVLKFLKESSLTRLIRAHQCFNNGFCKHFNGKCITVFSASSYNKPLGNSSSVLQLFQKDDKIKVHVFPPLVRLSKNEAHYYKVQNSDSNCLNNNLYFSLQHPKIINPPYMVRNSKQMYFYKPENDIKNINKNNNNLLDKPKFTTNHRKPIYFSPVWNSLKNFPSLPNSFKGNLAQLTQEDA